LRCSRINCARKSKYSAGVRVDTAVDFVRQHVANVCVAGATAVSGCVGIFGKDFEAPLDDRALRYRSSCRLAEHGQVVQERSRRACYVVHRRARHHSAVPVF